VVPQDGKEVKGRDRIDQKGPLSCNREIERVGGSGKSRDIKGVLIGEFDTRTIGGAEEGAAEVRLREVCRGQGRAIVRRGQSMMISEKG